MPGILKWKPEKENHHIHIVLTYFPSTTQRPNNCKAFLNEQPMRSSRTLSNIFDFTAGYNDA